MGLISRVSSRTYRRFKKMLRFAKKLCQVNPASKLRLTKTVQKCDPNIRFSTLLRNDPILNLPPLQNNETQITILGKITHVSQTHCLVDYGGKFEIRCPFNRKDKEDLVNWALDYHVGRKVVVNSNKHEDTDEFIGEARPVSSYQATGNMIRFYEDFQQTCERVDKHNKITQELIMDYVEEDGGEGEESVDEEMEVSQAGLKAENIQKLTK